MRPTPKDIFGCGHVPIFILFFSMSFFTYFDRGVLSASLDNIEDELYNGSSFKGGAIASCYLFGYCFSCPIFALLAGFYPPLKMSSIGMSIWCIGVVGTALVSQFALMAVARLLTGIGEASFLSFSATIIDIVAPESNRSFW